MSEKSSSQRILSIRAWNPKLFSFTLERPNNFRFVAGQWARLGVQTATGIVWRAYSIVSATHDPVLEFYSIVVPDGAFTSELKRLKVGDTVFLETQAYGFLTTSRFQTQGPLSCDLWMLSTGTGLAPFLSILQEPSVWDEYRHLILVHGVRHANELTYRELIDTFKSHPLFADYFVQLANKLIYLPLASRQSLEGGLNGRITTALDNGSLEASAGIDLTLESSRIMLCGNPDMVSETRTLLKTRGFTVSRNALPGQIAVENYW